MLRDIKGQVAWVTGAGSGVGQAASVALAKAGVKLALTGRRREALGRTAELVRDEGGDGAGRHRCRDRSGSERSLLCLPSCASDDASQRGGLIIQVSSCAGRYVSKLTGPACSAAKHGLVALSESLNQEECGHGIRSRCICPGEVATPIIDKRPVPVTEDDKQGMLQSVDLAEMIVFVARLPASVCVNEVLISPTWNRGYLEGVKL